MELLSKRSIPNALTVLRIILIGPFLWLLWQEHYEWALYIFMLAGLSDGLDGFIARYYQWTSRFGAIADPLADKMLMVFTYLSLGYLALLPWWLVSLVIIRDFIIIFAVLAYQYFIEEPYFSASFISKLNTVLQLVLVTAVLLMQAFQLFAAMIFWLPWLILLVAITTSISLVDYAWKWGWRAWSLKKIG